MKLLKSLLFITVLGSLSFNTLALDFEGDTFEWSGVVESVNLATRTFVIDEHTFSIQDGLNAQYKGETKLFAAIVKEGLVLSISGDNTEGRQVVTNVRVHGENSSEE